MKEEGVKMYFKGGKGILNPVDFNGEEIKEGNILTSDSFDPFFSESFYKSYFPSMTAEQIEEYKNKPLYQVKYNEAGFLYGEGLDKKLYLHDFRFKYTKIVKN